MPKHTIALGVTGSIAAYKAADICSQLKKRSVESVVIMTESALKFVGEQTFFTLSRNRVITDLWDVNTWEPEHISLSDRADLFLVAPATANFIGKYANGIADDALTTYALSHTGKVIIAPAMNYKMWQHPAVIRNCEILKERGVEFIAPISGELACGDVGTGKLALVEDIVDKVITSLSN